MKAVLVVSRHVSAAAGTRRAFTTASRVEIPHARSLVEYLEERGQWDKRHGVVAFQDAASGRALTFDRIRPSITAAGRALQKLDVKRLLVFLPNSPEFAIVMLGALSKGILVSTANPSYTATELLHQLRDSECTYIITVPAMKDTALEAAAAAGIPASCVAALGEAGTEPFSILAEGGEVEPDFHGIEKPCLENDIAVLPYSSGTTGLPKGVMLSHFNLAANVAQLIDDPQRDVRVLIDDKTVMLCVLPMFHIYAMMILVFLPLALGSTVVSMPRFDPELFLSTIQDSKVTTLPVVPPLMLFLAKHPLVDKYDMSSLDVIYTAAAPCDGQLQEDVYTRLKVPSIQIYGMTELSPGALTTPIAKMHSSGGKDLSDVRYGSVGVPLPNTDCKIVDPITRKELGPNEPGELLIKGPQVMLGYYKNAAATAETMEGEYLRTGDIFMRDDNGNHFAVDRLKELIKVKGFQVAPAELEGVVVAHPAVQDAAVVPMKDAEAGELPRACVVLKEGQQATADDIKAFVKERVAHYKQLGDVQFVEAVPKTASGKILRRELRDRFN